MAPNRKTGQHPLPVLGQRQLGPVVLDHYGRSLSLSYEQFAAILSPFLNIGDYYLEPLVDGGFGDPTMSELVFGPDGDVVMVPVLF